jgi:hypothetical protein
VTLWPAQTFDETVSQSIRVTVSGTVLPSRRLAIMIRAANRSEEAFFLAQHGEFVVYRSHIVARKLKLRPILIRQNAALARARQTANNIVGIEAWSRRLEIGIRVSSTGDSTSIPRTVGLAWALFLPRDVALDTRFAFVNAAWFLALVLPASFFVLRSGMREPGRRISRWHWWPLAMIIGVLAATPVAGLHHLSFPEWSGVMAGVAAGGLLERVSRGAVPKLKSHPVGQAVA